MKQFYSILISGMCFSIFLGLGSAHAQQARDTVWVSTFSFDDPAPASVYRGTYEFPTDTSEFQKILMYYTLKCDVSTRADNFPCGEWDYLTYTFVTDSAGVMDSTRRTINSYSLISGGSPDSLPFTYLPTYSYLSELQQSARYTATTQLDTARMGMGMMRSEDPLATNFLTSRAQYLWKAGELTTAGLAQGDITGLRLNLSKLGSDISQLTLRLKHTPKDSLTSTTYETSGFTQVYRLNTSFGQSGWKDLYFTTPFSWDGTSNVVVEFLFSRSALGTTHEVTADATPYQSGVVTRGDEYVLDFSQNSHVDIPQAAQTSITGNAPRTIEAWARARAFNGGGLFQAGSTGSAGRDFSFRTMGSDNLWRVQLWGAPDFDVTLPNSKDEWHHYAITYDGNATRVFYDGQLIQQSNFNLNTGNFPIRLGRWAGSRFDGQIDEVRVWNKALSATTIQNWMTRSIDATHPDYANLLAYLPINEGQGTMTADASGNNHDGQLVGLPAWRQMPAASLKLDWEATNIRPDVVFEQRVGTTVLDTFPALDSVPDAPVQAVLYQNPDMPQIIRHDAPNQPDVPTDTLIVWRAKDVSYVLNTQGQIVDSLPGVAPDSMLTRRTKLWFSNLVRYEIARYITPYGINLDLGPEGTTWIFDVTDYAPLLHDFVYLQAGNNQELLDLKFAMIKGTPPRDVLKISNIYDGSFSYASLLTDQNAPPVPLSLDPNGSMFRIKTRTSGHGFGSGENCAEFCRKTHSLSIDGQQQFAWEVWRECATNPVFPQGGTWIYDRAGWCPGDEVETFDHELTPFVQPGQQVMVDYGVSQPAPSGPNGNYVLRTQLITYGPQNFEKDVALEDIIAPSNTDIYGRFNPICSNPVVKIRNRGKEKLTSVLITYGVKDGFKPCFYRWTGELEFLEEEEVELPLFNWTGAPANNPIFYAEVSYPNYVIDDYDKNNRMEVPFTIPPQYRPGTVIEVRT
ncbi:MAG: LamG-like jellyroll fold domain-containing protein, partial [Bacteroidota bacterium]